jgi:hypothetical protein
MKRRIVALVKRLTETLQRWSGIDTVTYLHPVDDEYDPYFYISCDVYHIGQLPPPEERRELLGEISAFETSASGHKDRFLVGTIPVRLEYKPIDTIEAIIAAAGKGDTAGEKDSYVFYRIVNAEVAFARSDWLKGAREAVADLPDEYWDRLKKLQRSRAEHIYGDLSSAAARSDELCFTISAGGLVAAVCSLLFTVNRRFQPSGRSLAMDVSRLAILPDPLPGDLDSFVRQESQLSMEQRTKLAQLITTSVLAL